jgi:hypothetical protein
MFDHGLMRKVSQRVVDWRRSPFAGEDPELVQRLRTVAESFVDYRALALPGAIHATGSGGAYVESYKPLRERGRRLRFGRRFGARTWRRSIWCRC